MATSEEIERRVVEADSARSARRAATAKRIGDLAQRRAGVADQLNEIERELGETLAAANDVIGIDELAQFTDVPAADLAQWFDGRKPSRAKRKRSTAGAAAAKTGTDHRPASTKTPATRQEVAVPSASSVGTSATVT
ncbi:MULTISPECIES: hypothetical protein [Amycolatopsis]|uniref:hypothetical protein n=1 Tax=Amycolatopsis TaxID=1813 RepID=UPI00099C23DA|nr:MULTISPECIES: hypothetical protein [Amycolatopsis]